MRLDNLSLPVYTSHDVFDAVYQGQFDQLPKLVVAEDDEIIKFNNSAIDLGIPELNIYSALDITVSEFDTVMQSEWLMPDDYKNMDIELFIMQHSPTEHYPRIIEELQAYKDRNMFNLLRWLKYFVDTCRSNNVVWGVGRGSSVASYVLFIIGVHRIDSIKYNLDWQEFLR
jgi:DNA polymerase III alpha subunit